jgi:hypothetical protein
MSDRKYLIPRAGLKEPPYVSMAKEQFEKSKRSGKKVSYSKIRKQAKKMAEYLSPGRPQGER